MKRSIKKTIVAALIASSAITASQAASVNGTILADNGSLAVLQTGPATFNVIAPSVSGNWPYAKSFSFDVPDSPKQLRQCQIHVIAWGDGSVAQGMMAHFAGNGGANFTGKSGSSLNNVRMSSVTHAGSTAAGLSVANSNSGGIVQALGAPNTQFTSQPVVTGGIPGTWGPINLAAGMDGRGQVVFVWNENASALNGNPKNFRVISTPCDTVVRAAEPVDPTIAVYECSKQNGNLMDVSTGPGWALKQPNGSVAPASTVNNVAWSAVPNAQWIGPGGANTATGVWTYTRKVRIAECPNRAPVRLSIAYRADNIGTLRVRDASGAVITSANQAGTANYGFLPGSVTNHGYAFPSGAAGVYTVELEVQNTGGETGASMSVILQR